MFNVVTVTSSTLKQILSAMIKVLSVRHRRIHSLLQQATLLVAALCLSPLVKAELDLSAPPPPAIEARAHALIDFHSGRILAANRADEQMEPASLTKMMTAYVVFAQLKAGKVKLDDQVLISEKAWRMEGSRSFVEVGNRIPLEVLLKGMIIQSGNDASIALAEHVAGSEEVFAAMMNQVAKKLGMTHTHFMNATGLPDPQHYSTALDIARLGRALIRDFPEHYDWHSIKEFTYNGITQMNRNKLLWQDATVDGIKTGHTETAGFCLVASAKQDDMRLISVILGTTDENARARESQKLLGYGFRFYETHRLYASQETLATVRVWQGAEEHLPLGIARELYITIPRGQYSQLKASMKIKPTIMAPVQKGATYGSVMVNLGDKTITEVPLISLQQVEEGGIFTRLKDKALLMLE